MPPFAAPYVAELMTVLVIFARLGTALMFLPGFGETQIPARHRLSLGLLLSIALSATIPAIPPGQPALLGLLLAREALIGLYLGAGARVLFATLHMLGAVIAHVSSLSNAMAAGMTAYEGSSAVSALLMVAGVALIFATDSHHLILRGLFFSYQLMPANWIALDELALQMAKLVSRGFYLAALLGAPFFVAGILLNLGMGIANRVMPNMPILFVAGPALVMFGFLLLMLTQEALLGYFIDTFAQFFEQLEV